MSPTTPPSTSLGRALWLTLPGAPSTVAFGWMAWMVASWSAAPLLAHLLGPAGTVLAVLGVGWALARRGLVPSECLRRYHLDDAELTALGPGRLVRRLPWSEIAVLTQDRQALRIESRGTRLALPLAALVRTAGWNELLTRVVAGLAADMWSLIEDGEAVRLRPRSDPATRALAWWAYAPALAACATGAGSEGLVLAVVAMAGERLLALLRGAASITLDRAGLGFRRRGRRVLLPWAEAEVARAPHGLFVAVAGGAYGLVDSRLPNFVAAAPVIETKAQLGSYSAAVHFRVRVADGALAVVGEVEPAA